MTGFCYTETKHTFGFIRWPDGKTKKFEVPGHGRGTETAGINDAGVVVGNYRGGNFLRFP
jgi:hypothetical protein